MTGKEWITIKEKFNVFKYLSPSVEPEMVAAIDRQSTWSICNISLIACIFEMLGILVYMAMNGWKLDESNISGFNSAVFCAIFSLIVFLITKVMIKDRKISHINSLSVKIIFFVVYTLWAVQADMRHYAVGDQMLTFFTVQLLATCFITIEPLIGIPMVFAAYAGFYVAAYGERQAVGIDVYNFVLLAILSAVSMCVQYHTRLYLARKEKRLDTASHRDALTGLRNRLALEEDAKKICGKTILVYMIDIDYFKEINDHYGHVMGDEVLVETGSRLQSLYPDALCYRYGGDEFLILSEGDGSQNYAESEYHFDKQSSTGMRSISISIGSAMGNPQTTDEVFTLISSADKALYEAKARTHSPEYGGHDRRQRR